MPSTVSTARSILLGDLIPTVKADPSVTGADNSSIPAGLQRRIAQEIATLWDVPWQKVTTQWGRVGDADSLGDETSFRLIGRGLDSWFAIVFDREGRPAFAARMRSGTYVERAVAVRALRAGMVVKKNDMAFVEQVQWGPPSDTLVEAVPAPGWRVLHDIGVGELIAEPAAVPVPVIARGDRVRLTWRRGVVTVSIEGIALHEAAVGHQITVRLNGRRGHARGTVTGPAKARLHS